MEIKLAPSILAADFGRLAEQVQAVDRAGADWIHVDVMDGRFVPEITMGPLAARAVRAATRLPIDVHLMIVEPERHLESFARAGATSLVVHAEACPHLYLTLQQIASAGLRPGVALNPATPPELVAYVLPLVSTVLVMTVEPGAGGQPFIPAMLAKVEALAARRAALGLAFEIAVDGGIGSRVPRPRLPPRARPCSSRVLRCLARRTASPPRSAACARRASCRARA